MLSLGANSFRLEQTHFQKGIGGKSIKCILKYRCIDASWPLLINSAVVYYFCHCMSLQIGPGILFSLDRRLVILGERKLSFWLSACSVLIVVPLL